MGLEMSLRVVIGTLLLAAAPAITGSHAAAQATAPAKPVLSKIDRSHAGEAPPKVMFELRGGKTTSVAAFKGKPVLVNLWATWCVPCLAEMPEIDRLAAAQAGRLVVLPISQDLEGWRAVDKFFKPTRFRTLVPYLDQPGNYAVAMEAKGLPLSILYGADGREKWRVNGPLKWTSPEVAAALR